MQLYALDSKNQLISAQNALKQTNYYCLECSQIVRVRGGIQRKSHFYHLDLTPFCRQHQKGPIHLHLQSYVIQQLPSNDGYMEYRFPEINRIADVAWLSERLVFEIQYSPISAEEVLQRNRDYQQLGWKVVWILHDHRYNQKRITAAERALEHSPHYFTNMDKRGQGVIYDQFSVNQHHLRKERFSSLPITLGIPQREFPLLERGSLNLLEMRIREWKLSFEGDLLHLFLTSPEVLYLEQALAKEHFYFPSHQVKWWEWLKKGLEKGCLHPYRVFFRYLLEKNCR